MDGLDKERKVYGSVGPGDCIAGIGTETWLDVLAPQGPGEADGLLGADGHSSEPAFSGSDPCGLTPAACFADFENTDPRRRFAAWPADPGSGRVE
jgi:hypothetical protein